jgi:carboxyl-terminal processing protease
MKSLRGERGSEVNFTIYRSTNRREYEYSIIRDKIPIYAVDVSLLYNNDVGYVNLSRFSETSTIEVVRALEELKNKGMKKIVLDLRNNPGGILSEAVSISDLFLDESKIVVYTNGRIPLFDAEYFADNVDGYESYPLIILVNRGSASASEIVAGAIQDWDRGLLVGETTFGKGLVQRPFLLSDGSAVRITVSRYYTPSGRAIQRDYSNGKDEYYSEIYSEPDSGRIDSTNIEYTTKGGRTVFGGGGITPDTIVSYDNLTNYTVELTRNNIYYQYVRHYLDNNKEKLTNKFKTLNEFNSDFNLHERKNEFVKFASVNKVEYNKAEFKLDKEYIFQRLKAYIARELWGNEGWYSVMLKNDKQFQTAVKLFENDLKTNKVDIDE